MSIEEIKEKYGIATDDLKEIETELLVKMKVVHPDANPEQSDDSAKELNAAIEFVRSLQKEEKQMMVPVEDVIRTLAEVMKDNKKQEVIEIETLNRKLDANIEFHNKSKKRIGVMRRLGSVFFLGLLTIIWTFPKEVLDYPLIQLLFGHPTSYDKEIYVQIISIIWFSLLIITVFLWIRTIYIESKEKEILDKLKSESKQNELFMSFCKILKKPLFSKQYFMEYIFRNLTHRKYEYRNEYTLEYQNEFINEYDLQPEEDIPKFKRRIIIQTVEEIQYRMKIEEEVLQSTADIILLRAQEKGLIEKVRSNSLIDEFKLIHQNDEEK